MPKDKVIRPVKAGRMQKTRTKTTILSQRTRTSQKSPGTTPSTAKFGRNP